jgi:hypothetical protein
LDTRVTISSKLRLAERNSFLISFVRQSSRYVGTQIKGSQRLSFASLPAIITD